MSTQDICFFAEKYKNINSKFWQEKTPYMELWPYIKIMLQVADKRDILAKDSIKLETI